MGRVPVQSRGLALVCVLVRDMTDVLWDPEFGFVWPFEPLSEKAAKALRAGLESGREESPVFLGDFSKYAEDGPIPLTEGAASKELKHSLETALDEPPVYLGSFAQYADDD